MKAIDKNNRKIYSPLCEDFSIGKGILKYLKNAPYMLSVIITALLSYSFFIVNETITIDSLSNDRYNSGLLFAQGRLVSPLISRLFMEQTNNYSFTNILGVALLILSVIIICCVFEKLFKPKTILPAIAFSCIYISFPLCFEYYAFSGSLLLSGICMNLLSLSLYLIVAKKSNFLRFYLPIILIAIMFSSYEAFLFSFMCLICVSLVSCVSKDESKIKNGMGFLIHSALVTVIAVGIEYAISNGAIALFKVEPDYRSDKTVFWFFSGVMQGVKSLLKSYVIYWDSKVFCYLPFTVMLIALIVFVTLFIKDVTKKGNNKVAVIFIYGAVILSVLAFSIIKCTAFCYRCETAFPVFAGFVMYLLLLKVENKKVFFKNACVIIVGVIILSQALSCDYWSRLNHEAYTNEKQTICTVDSVVTERYGKSKPVVFIGAYKLPDNIVQKNIIQDGTISKKIYDLGLKMDGDVYYAHNYRITSTQVRSYLAWAETPFNDPNAELYKFAEHHGCYFIHAEKEMYYEALKKYENLPNWPDKDSVADAGDYIVVKLGDLNKNP